MKPVLKLSLPGLALAASFAPAVHAADARNVIFFLGDGMGPATVTAARIMQYGETGSLTMDTLERTARIKTYSNDAQTTDSAPSMAAYMTGVKMNNEVISMSQNTVAREPGKDANGNLGIDHCPAQNAANGTPASTILELAKAKGKAVGAITTTELTHATPATTFAHICNRNAQYAIAAQSVPGGAGYNAALLDGVDVLMGGGRNHYTPFSATNKNGRADGRNLLTEFAAKGYTVAATKADMVAAPNNKKFIGLYSSKSHLEYELDRTATPPLGEGATQPSLAEMTVKAIDLLSQNANGYFLMVEGGRIDHALHGINAKRALVDTIAFDNAIKAALDKIRLTDPTLADTLIVVTADHDHTLAFNGYGKRGNPILDINRDYKTGQPSKDADGNTYTTLVFGNGPNRPALRGNVDSATALGDNYLQETGVRLASETHGGGDVKLFATGAGAKTFKGTLDNTKVFGLLKNAFGL
ncbi:alkaline phosphatase [Janthinobacterium agaricidamnosum]|uniref:Alkaline phosphatase family protein n=1 Tax=Janthinobacterium agaricidamnosum NBRC 102515 = DSM 9628 TaxID=1349767 RepID=W0VCX4_9BURK|nr:alkaline phosphatase [Janthinobacterium agaricidamnosum]CDG85228.1 alkaline phosphatase family protein [Janthinobacterium agaricidamnosum NBRC 102515 = DSM 9628]